MGLGIGEVLGGIAQGVTGIVNYRNQKEQQRYDRAMDQLMMEREDTAVQRRMEDMKAAGINPNLAAGSAAAAGHAGGGSAPQAESPAKAIEVMADLANKFANVAQSQAQAQILDMQKEREAYAMQYHQNVSDMNYAMLQHQSSMSDYARRDAMYSQMAREGQFTIPSLVEGQMTHQNIPAHYIFQQEAISNDQAMSRIARELSEMNIEQLRKLPPNARFLINLLGGFINTAIVKK